MSKTSTEREALRRLLHGVHYAHLADHEADMAALRDLLEARALTILSEPSGVVAVHAQNKSLRECLVLAKKTIEALRAAVRHESSEQYEEALEALRDWDETERRYAVREFLNNKNEVR